MTGWRWPGRTLLLWGRRPTRRVIQLRCAWTLSRHRWLLLLLLLTGLSPTHRHWHWTVWWCSPAALRRQRLLLWGLLWWLLLLWLLLLVIRRILAMRRLCVWHRSSCIGIVASATRRHTPRRLAVARVR